MLATSRLLSFILIGSISCSTFAGGAALVRNAEYFFKVRGYARETQIATLTAKDLGHARKVDNIAALLELAEAENRIDPIKMMRLQRLFSPLPEGDKALLSCLQLTKCQPEAFADILTKSKLHSEVARRNPELGLTHVNHAVGQLNENLMIRYFESSGWTRINGQVGRTGFDGLFVKMKDDVITDVLIAESKYNTSSLQKTNFGTQMSEDWVKRKIAELLARHPNDETYRQIDAFIESGAYRAVLWNLKVDDEMLKIGLSKVKSKGGSVEIVSPQHSDVDELTTPFTNSVALHSPRSEFERRIIGWYNDELRALKP